MESSARMLGCMLRQKCCWRIQNKLQAVVHVRFLGHMLRSAGLELTGCGVVLRPMAFGSLEVERHVHLHCVSNRRGARSLDTCLFLEDPLGVLLLTVMWGVDVPSEEARRLVRLRLPFKNQSARLGFVCSCYPTLVYPGPGNVPRKFWACSLAHTVGFLHGKLDRENFSCVKRLRWKYGSSLRSSRAQAFDTGKNLTRTTFI